MRLAVVPGGCGQPGGACPAVEAGFVHHPAVAPGGNPRDQGVAEGADGDAASDGCFFRQRAARAVEPQDRVVGGAQLRRAGRVAVTGLSAPVAPRVRLRLGRPGRGHPADPGLSRPPQHPAHGALHRRQSGAVREAMVVSLRCFIKSYMILK